MVKVRTINLTQGQVAIVDASDYEWLNKWKWMACYSRTMNSFYAWRWSPMVNGERHRIFMHRQILGLECTDKRQGDHVESGRTLDNRRSNLRVASCAQNCFNRRIEQGTSSGLKGVCRDRGRTLWRARICVQGKRLQLGSFNTKKDAHAAYVSAAKIHYGEFARPV